jgi:hypothetical protein
VYVIELKDNEREREGKGEGEGGEDQLRTPLGKEHTHTQTLLFSSDTFQRAQ